MEKRLREPRQARFPERLMRALASKKEKEETHESGDHYQERNRCRCERDNRGDRRRVQDLGDQQSHGAVHHRGTTLCQGPHGITRRRSGWPCDRVHCLLSPDHFGRHPELVRPWACFGIAIVPAPRYWQSPDTGRAVTTERYECSRMLSRGASGLLQEIRVQKHVWTCA